MVGQGGNSGTTVYLATIGEPTYIAGIGALAFSTAACVTRIFAGPLIDFRGRAIVMIVGSFVMFIGTCAPLIVNDGAFFVIWRVLQGLGFSAATTAASTAAADVLPSSRLGEGIGYFGLGQAVAMSIGPALSIFLISTNPPENFYIGLSAFAFLAISFALLCRYEKNPSKLPATSDYRIRWEQGEVGRIEGGSDEPDMTGSSEENGSFSIKRLIDGVFEPRALNGAIPMMLISVAFGFGIFYIGGFGTAIGVGNAGIFYTVSAVSMVIIRLTTSRFIDSVAPIKLMGVSVVFGLIAFSIFIVCNNIVIDEYTQTVFYAAGIPYGISLGIATPLNQSISVKLSPAERWGAANGLFLLGIDAGIGVTATIWGYTNSALGYTPTMLIVMLFIIASFIAARALYPKE